MLNRKRKRSFTRYNFRKSSWSRIEATSKYKQYLKDRGRLRCSICGFCDPSIHPFFLIEIHHCKRVADGGGHDFANLLEVCPLHHNLADRLSKKNKHLNITRELMISLIKEHEFNRVMTYGVQYRII